jgi:hypothetical protein
VEQRRDLFAQGFPVLVVLSAWGKARTKNPCATYKWTFVVVCTGDSEPETQVPALQQVGVLLGRATQSSEISQQQALLLANQLEFIAAVSANHIDSRYIFINDHTSRELLAFLV